MPSSEPKISGHLQVRERRATVSLLRELVGRGRRRIRQAGPARVKDSGKKTGRGAIIWWAAEGPCPRDALTPKTAQEALDAMLDEAALRGGIAGGRRTPSLRRTLVADVRRRH